mgnify:CR=1 FL=1
MAIESVNEWEEKKKGSLMSDESFHLDQSKITDPVEKLIEKLGLNGAFDELADQLPANTNQEVVRQMKLILNKVIKQGREH